MKNYVTTRWFVAHFLPERELAWPPVSFRRYTREEFRPHSWYLRIWPIVFLWNRDSVISQCGLEGLRLIASLALCLNLPVVFGVWIGASMGWRVGALFLIGVFVGWSAALGAAAWAKDAEAWAKKHGIALPTKEQER